MTYMVVFVQIGHMARRKDKEMYDLIVSFCLNRSYGAPEE